MADNCEHRNTSSAAIVEDGQVTQVIVTCDDCGHTWIN